jgi:hypothetical protein
MSLRTILSRCAASINASATLSRCLMNLVERLQFFFAHRFTNCYRVGMIAVHTATVARPIVDFPSNRTLSHAKCSDQIGRCERVIRLLFQGIGSIRNAGLHGDELQFPACGLDGPSLRPRRFATSGARATSSVPGACRYAGNSPKPQHNCRRDFLARIVDGSKDLTESG